MEHKVLRARGLCSRVKAIFFLVVVSVKENFKRDFVIKIERHLIFLLYSLGFIHNAYSLQVK